jgi:hypothetical protein
MTPEMSEIAADLRSLAVPVDTLHHSPRNVRRHSLSRDIPVLMQSLERFGQRKPIVVRRSGEVLAGNGTLQAAERLGWTHIAVSWFDGTEDEAQAYALVDNRSAELSEWDYPALAAQLKAVRERDGAQGIERLGWSEMDVAPLLAADWTPAPVDPNAEFDAGQMRGRPIAEISAAQRTVIDRAIQAVRRSEEDPKMSEGRALELICADYLAGASIEAESPA